jgi:hypothetical protein
MLAIALLSCDLGAPISYELIGQSFPLSHERREHRLGSPKRCVTAKQAHLIALDQHQQGTTSLDSEQSPVWRGNNEAAIRCSLSPLLAWKFVDRARYPLVAGRRLREIRSALPARYRWQLALSP